MYRYFIISELTVFFFVAFSIFGKKTRVLAVEPLFLYSRLLLQKLVLFFIRAGLSEWTIDDYPNLARLKEDPVRSLLYDVFGETELWQDKTFKFSEADNAIGEYSMPFKHIVTNYCFLEKHVTLLLMKEIHSTIGFSNVKFLGLPEDTLSAIGEYCSNSKPPKGTFIPVRGINLVYSILMVLVCLIWTITHCRLRIKKAKDFFFAADFINDDRDKMLYDELDDGGPILMVRRGKQTIYRPPNELRKYSFCFKESGIIFFTDICSVIKSTISDTILLYLFAGKMHPLVFWRIVMLPYKRLLWRGLFQCYKPRFFWARDPYNEDHIIRRQELNRVGGKLYSVNTGTISWAILSPPWRYISFDRYYVFGKGVYKEYYGNTWPTDMEVIPSGTFTAERRHYLNRFENRPGDIAIFLSVYTSEPEVHEFVVGVAKAFPRKRVYLQIKKTFRSHFGAQNIINKCSNIPNIVYTEERVYDLFEKATFGISDPSSIVNESLQLGMKAFTLDIPSVHKTNPFRKHPEMIITSATEFIERIELIENKSWAYPTASFQDLVDMSGIVFADRVRKDMGLIPKDRNPKPLISNFNTL